MRTASALTIAWLSIAVTLSGCSGCGNDPGAVPCDTGTDEDGDNYGEGCPAGPDCNDSDATIHEDCCADDPTYQGCPCDPGVDTIVSCFDGPDGLSDTPPCMKGTRSCEADGFWGYCGGQVLPENEVCDGEDNDCDGTADDGVQSACGNCLPGCDDFSVDTEPFPMDDPAEADGVGLDENGDLVLDQSTYEDHYLWIANDAEGTVSKIDTRNGNEVARYPSVTRDPARLINHVGRPIAAWDEGGGGFGGGGYADNRPSRTAIDFYGDMWVANRAHDGGNNQPSITKIRNDIETCPDLNGNSVIDTSRDLDVPANGIQADEFFGEADECIVMTVVVGAAGGIARALAIDAGAILEGGDDDPGNVWVGMHGERAFYQINGVDGSIMQRVATPEVRSYGAAIDSVGRLWTLDDCCGTAGFGYIDTNQNPAPWTTVAKPVLAGAGHGNYGITVDLEDRVWIGGYPYGGLLRYDPATNTWATAQINGYYNNGGHVRGVGIDTRGNVWAALHPGDNDGLVARIDADTLASTGVWQLDEGASLAVIPVGVGVDFDGDVWTVNQQTSNASRLHIDQTTGEPAPHPDTGSIVDVFPVGRNPYTYSDFTGLGLRTVTRPTGEYRLPIQGCEGTDQAHWTEIRWDATTPPATSVEVYVRVGDDLATLGQQPLHGPWVISPADLQAPPEGPVPDGRYLLLIIRLISEDRDSTPIVHGFDVQWGCPGDVPEFVDLPEVSPTGAVGAVTTTP